MSGTTSRRLLGGRLVLSGDRHGLGVARGCRGSCTGSPRRNAQPVMPRSIEMSMSLRPRDRRRRAHGRGAGNGPSQLRRSRNGRRERRVAGAAAVTWRILVWSCSACILRAASPSERAKLWASTGASPTSGSFANKRRRVEARPDCGQYPYALLAEPGRRNDLVAWLCGCGVEHGGGPRCGPIPSLTPSPIMRSAMASSTMPPGDDVSVEPGAIGEQAGELGAGPRCRRSRHAPQTSGPRSRSSA